MRLAVPLVLIVLAGCVGPSAPSPDEPAPPQPWSFDPAVVALTGCQGTSCYEPNVAADLQGRLFVVNGNTAPVAVSEDGGVTWAERAPPPMPVGLDGTQSDVLVQVAPTGRLYWSALVVLEPLVLAGIQVAWSDDGARTWAGDVQLSLATATPQVVAPDRQWLGFAPDGTLYVTYNQIPSGIWIARSDDEGRTWSAWTRAAPVEGREGGVGQSGPPVVTSDGAVLVPACQGAAATEAEAGTYVFRSEDRGATFERVRVAAACSWFPIATVGPGDHVLLGNQPDGATVAWSTDGGRTFEGPVAWGEGGTTAGVWPLLRADGHVFLAWYGSDGSLHVARGGLEGPAETLVVGEATAEGRSGAITDFASAALLPDGRVATVWVEGTQVRVAVAATS